MILSPHLQPLLLYILVLQLQFWGYQTFKNKPQLITWRNNWYTAHQMFSWGGLPKRTSELRHQHDGKHQSLVQYRIFANTSTYFAIFRRNPLHLDWNLHDCEVLFQVSHFWFCSRWVTFGFVQGESHLVLFQKSHFWFCSRWVTFGFVQGESLLVLFQVSHVWFCSRWVTFGFVPGESLLVLFKVSHFWFCSRWVNFGFVQGESHLVLFQVSHFWFCSRWVTFGFLVAKTTQQHTDHTKQQTSITKSKSRRALLTHFDPSIQDHYVVSKHRAPNTQWRGVTFQDKGEL